MATKVSEARNYSPNLVNFWILFDAEKFSRVTSKFQVYKRWGFRGSFCFWCLRMPPLQRPIINFHQYDLATRANTLFCALPASPPLFQFQHHHAILILFPFFSMGGGGGGRWRTCTSCQEANDLPLGEKERKKIVHRSHQSPASDLHSTF